MSVTFVVVSVVLLCFRPTFPFSSFQPFLFIGGFDSSALCRSRRALSQEYLLPKVGFDAARRTSLVARLPTLGNPCPGAHGLPAPLEGAGAACEVARAAQAPGHAESSGKSTD